MPTLSKMIKPLVALTLAAAVLGAQQGCSQESKASVPPPLKPGEVRTVALTVTEKGFEPTPVTVRQGEPVKLVLTRTTDHTCATEIVLEDYNIHTELPLNKPVEVAFTPTKAGELVYGCAMGKMIRGVISVQ